MASVSEVAKFISDLGISKVTLKDGDIESILQTIVYDGKAEKCESMDGSSLYRAVPPLIPSAGLSRWKIIKKFSECEVTLHPELMDWFASMTIWNWEQLTSI